MNEILIDKIRGVVYGQAVGDAMGLGTEFMSKKKVKECYPMGLSDYKQIIQDVHRQRWIRGEWTDDTDQMLCIFDSLLEKNGVDEKDIAKRLREWRSTDGRGVGQTVFSVMRHSEFLVDPHKAARDVWENSGRKMAANGGIMRTSILGVWGFNNEQLVRESAERVCKITHYDPRCVGSCVAVCMMISKLLAGISDSIRVIDEVQENVLNYDDQIISYFEKAKYSLDALHLDEGLNAHEEDRIGYTLKTMGAGIWVLLYAENYQDGIIKIIHEGGDADSNAAVAGSLLGAKYGFSNIPLKWIEGLQHSNYLEDRIKRLIKKLEKVL